MKEKLALPFLRKNLNKLSTLFGGKRMLQDEKTRNRWKVSEALLALSVLSKNFFEIKF